MDPVNLSRDNTSPNRKFTDIYAPIVWLILFFSIIIYCLLHSNSSLLIKGRDDCGNICGELNDGNTYDQCGSHDMRNLSKLLIERREKYSWDFQYKCVEQCPLNHTETIIQCSKKGDFVRQFTKPNYQISYVEKLNAFTKYSKTNWLGIGLCCVFTFLFSRIVLIMLRFIPQATIWAIPILLTAVLFIIAFVSVLSSFDSGSNGIQSSLYLYVGFFVILMCVFAKKIILAGKIFGVTAKSTMNVACIVLVPILTFLILTILISAFLYTSMLIETSGTFTPGTSEGGQFQLQYQVTKIMKFARILNILTFFWLANFIVNCQHFVVAGSVTKWYFTRDKSGIGGISKSSVINLVRFHLGSVCFGSIAIPVVRVIHFGLRVVKFFKVTLTWCCEGLQSQSDQTFNLIDRILGTNNKSAYILIESRGTQFSESGRTSYDLMLENLGDVYWLNLFRDILLLLSQMFVSFLGIFAGISIVQSQSRDFTVISPAAVDFAFTFLFAHCIFMAYGMAIDTILICLCIDFDENDGDSRPYFMSDELKKIAKKIRKSCGLEIELKQSEEAEDNMIPMTNQ